MQTALHQDLIPAKLDRLSNFVKQFSAREHVPLRALGRPIERAKITDRSTDIRVVDVAIDVVGSIRLRVHSQGYLVCSRANRGQVSAFEQ